MVRRVGGSVRHSSREFGSILLAVCLTKIVLIVCDVHYQLPVEVIMETVIHFMATLIPCVAKFPLYVVGSRLETGALLRLGSCSSAPFMGA